MSKRSKMICPACGAEMNHHAEKVNYQAALENPELIDPDFGGVLMEFHACPKCGEGASRRSVS
jgi:ribosomal protein S27AE